MVFFFFLLSFGLQPLTTPQNTNGTHRDYTMLLKCLLDTTPTCVTHESELKEFAILLTPTYHYHQETNKNVAFLNQPVFASATPLGSHYSLALTDTSCRGWPELRYRTPTLNTPSWGD